MAGALQKQSQMRSGVSRPSTPLISLTFFGQSSVFVPLLLLLVASALRARDFGNPMIHVDEQFYLLVGDRMLHGALPYIDIWDRKPIGLFLIFAAIRLLPGDGILAYQLVATLFAVGTAWLVEVGGRRLGASRTGAVAAAIAYLIWLSLLSGRGGQSPVFYNLFVAGAANLTFRLPRLAERRDQRSILVNGLAACLLAGLAIQTKYTPAVEGVFFGIVHLWFFRRAGAGYLSMVGVASLWCLLGVAPTVLVFIDYALRGPVAFQAFWFSNFASIALRRGYPAAKIAARLAGTTAQLSPLIVCAIISARVTPRSPVKHLAFGWLVAALIAYSSLGVFFDHYALPLMAPLTIIVAPVLGRYRAALFATLGAGMLLFVCRVGILPDERATAREVARVVSANMGSECPYVFAGDAVVYHLARACLPTAYAFPSTLAYEPERGATGIDEATEVARIMRRKPPIVVTMNHPLAPWNMASARIVAAALAHEYRLIFSAPREGARVLVYLRNDRHPAR